MEVIKKIWVWLVMGMPSAAVAYYAVVVNGGGYFAGTMLVLVIELFMIFIASLCLAAGWSERFELNI